MNPLVTSIPPSLIRAINARKRPGDIDLGLGEPTLRPEIGPFEAAVAWVAEHGCPYTTNAGDQELRERIAGRYGAGRFASAAEVCVTVGSEEALYLAIKALLDPAENEVLIVEPCYLAYAKICAMEGVAHRMVPLSGEDGFRPSAAAVLAEVRESTRLVVLNSPANPTGRIWPAGELEALARGLAGRSRPVYVLADDVYRELYYGHEAPRSVAEWHPHTLIAGSLSKSSALTGLRLGWLIGPREVVDAAVKVHQFVNTAASTYSQRVAIEIFREPGALAAHRPWYLEAREGLLGAADRWGVTLIEPEGAFYAMARIPAGPAGGSVSLAERLLEEQRVVTVPGRAFGDSGEGWLRLSWAGAPETVAEGLRRIGLFFDDSMPAAS